MTTPRSFHPFLHAALVLAVALAASLTFSSPSIACDHEASACACGAACPEHMGDHADSGCAGEAGAADRKADDAGGCAGEHAAGEASGDKPAGSCACNGGAPAAAPAAAAGGHEGAANQMAVIDPATGKLVVPKPGEVPVDAVPEKGVSAQGNVAAQVHQKDGGVVAVFPPDRAMKAVASVDEDGKTHSACQE